MKLTASFKNFWRKWDNCVLFHLRYSRQKLLRRVSHQVILTLFNFAVMLVLYQGEA